MVMHLMEFGIVTCIYDLHCEVSGMETEPLQIK